MTFKKENYRTTLEKAQLMALGFREAFSRFEERLVLDQCSAGMFRNYGRNLAHSKRNLWKTCASNGDFLFPVEALAKTYRGKFMEKLMAFLTEKGTPIQLALRRKLYDKNWVVYAKEPFKITHF